MKFRRCLGCLAVCSSFMVNRLRGISLASESLSARTGFFQTGVAHILPWNLRPGGHVPPRHTASTDLANRLWTRWLCFPLLVVPNEPEDKLIHIASVGFGKFIELPEIHGRYRLVENL